MLVLLSLLIQFNASHAMNLDEWQYMVYTKDQLKQKGFQVKSEGQKFEALNAKEGISIRKAGWHAQSVAKTMIAHYTDGTPHYEDLETTLDESKVLANTHCDANGRGKDSKMTCRTLTAEYCGSVLKLNDSGFFSTDLSKLTECGEILSKINFDVGTVKLYHDAAMKRISATKDVVAENLESSIGAPRSLKSIVEDFAVCKTLSGRWIGDAKKTDQPSAKTVN